MIRELLHLYIILLIVDVVLSYLPQFRRNPVVMWIHRAADFTCKPIRRLLPPNLPLDVSPLIVILILKLVMVLW